MFDYRITLFKRSWRSLKIVNVITHITMHCNVGDAHGGKISHNGMTYFLKSTVGPLLTAMMGSMLIAPNGQMEIPRHAKSRYHFIIRGLDP